MPNNYLPSVVSSPVGLEQMFSLESELCKVNSRNNSNGDISTGSPKRCNVMSSPRVHQLTVQPLVVRPVAADQSSEQQLDSDPESPKGCDDTPVTFYLPSATSTPASTRTSSLSSSPSILATAPSYSSPTPSTKSWKSRRSPGGSSHRNLGSARSAWMEENEMSVMASTLSYKLDSSI